MNERVGAYKLLGCAGAGAPRHVVPIKRPDTAPPAAKRPAPPRAAARPPAGRRARLLSSPTPSGRNSDPPRRSNRTAIGRAAVHAFLRVD